MYKTPLTITAIIFSLLTFFSTSTLAKDNFKVGIVNVKLLLEQSPQAQKASAKLKKEFSPKQKKLQKLVNRLKLKQEKYEKNKLIMSPKQQEEKERELSISIRDIKRKQNDIQEALNLRRNAALIKIQNTVNIAIKHIAIKKNFDVVLYEGVAYSNDKSDITKLVLNYLKTNNLGK